MDWLKEIRMKQEKTQDWVADEAGISRGAYCNIENGERRPSVEVAKRIAGVLGFDWTKFYEDTKPAST